MCKSGGGFASSAPGRRMNIESMDCFNENCGYNRANACHNDNAIFWENCTGRIKEETVMSDKYALSWKDVFYPHKRYGSMNRCLETALLAEYPCFCWNDRIYRTSDGSGSGLTIKDVV